MLVKTLFINDCDIVNYKEACMFIGDIPAPEAVLIVRMKH